MAPDAIRAYDVSVKILRRFSCRAQLLRSEKFFLKGCAGCRLAFGFSGPPCTLVVSAVSVALVKKTNPEVVPGRCRGGAGEVPGSCRGGAGEVAGRCWEGVVYTSFKFRSYMIGKCLLLTTS